MLFKNTGYRTLDRGRRFCSPPSRGDAHDHRRRRAWLEGPMPTLRTPVLSLRGLFQDWKLIFSCRAPHLILHATCRVESAVSCQAVRKYELIAVGRLEARKAALLNSGSFFLRQEKQVPAFPGA